MLSTTPKEPRVFIGSGPITLLVRYFSIDELTAIFYTAKWLGIGYIADSSKNEIYFPTLFVDSPDAAAFLNWLELMYENNHCQSH